MKFAEDVAAFANGEGGVLIVGVTDDRRIVGISDGDTESRLKDARDTLSERVLYPRDIVKFHQVGVLDAAGVTKLCLVIIVAKAMEAVGVSDGNDRYSYPIRRETGVSKPSPDYLLGAKIHIKSDGFDFLDILRLLIRDRQPPNV